MVLLAALATGCGSDDGSGGESPPGPKPLTAMSFNVYCEFCDIADEYDPWELRLEHFGDVFARHDPDLVGLQELAPRLLVPSNAEQLLAARGEGFAAITFGEPESSPNPDSTLLYRESRFTLLEHGEYWLSPTPDDPGSTGFSDKQTLARYVVWARLRDRFGERELYVANTHFDNNTPSQEKSAALLKQRTAPFASDVPVLVLVLGDFNSKPDSPSYATLTGDDGGFALTDTFQLCDAAVSEGGAATGEVDAAARIDHIFTGGTLPSGDAAAWTCPRWVEDHSVYGPEQRLPSDHYPVVAELSY